MTVFNTGYSTLEEAWADNYLSPQLQQKKSKKKRSDPICDLYNMGNPHYPENDMISFANKYYEQYEKAKYQKPMMLEREPAPIQMPSDNHSRQVQVQEERDEFPEADYALEREMAAARPPQRPRYTEAFSDPVHQVNQTFLFYDIVLYIISGVLLIFMMEQFVRLGIQLA